MIIFHDYTKEESITSNHLDDITNGTVTHDERHTLVYITVNVAVL